MVQITGLDPSSEVPLYRQISDQIQHLIDSGCLRPGSRLPATRELAGQLGLNRTTVSAAYELLESNGLISGQVGRGSFVADRPAPAKPADDRISFASSRPSELLFPVDDFRAACSEVIGSAEAIEILQLGSASGYGPLRKYLLQRAKDEGAASGTDDILITSGCQQAFDLLQRTALSSGEAVIVEDPVYPGLKQAFQRSGARLIGVPFDARGLDLARLERAVAEENPALIVVNSNFQNPTGHTLTLEARESLLSIIERSSAVLIENDMYGELRYEGTPVPSLKQLSMTRGGVARRTVSLRSFSKVAFPGLRVGWVIGARSIIERLTEAKQWSDLHSDQLSQAVLLRFAESGRLAQHRERVLAAGRERLRAVLSACGRYLPAGSDWTRPEGGMNVWVRLPEPLDAGDLLPFAEREGVTYSPGGLFAVGAVDRGGFRISFSGVAPERIDIGVALLGRVFRSGMERVRERLESAVIV